MNTDKVIETVLPHSDFGDLECWGCLTGVVRGDVADIVCTECSKIVRSVPASDLRRVLNEMEGIGR